MITFTILPEKSVIVIRSVGDTSIEECVALMKTMREDPNFSDEFDVINDNREMTSAYSIEDIQEAIYHQKSYELSSTKKSKNAIVVREDLYFGVSRTYEMLYELDNSNRTVEVFRDINNALAWLEIDGLDID